MLCHAGQCCAVLSETVHCKACVSLNGAGQRIRIVGSGLSPNGMAFSSEGMLSTALLDDIIAVDTEKQQVTVQAGARVDQVCLFPCLPAASSCDCEPCLTLGAVCLTPIWLKGQGAAGLPNISCCLS